MLIAIDSLTDQEISASPNDLTAIKEIAERYGFCLVKSSFTQNQMERIHENMLETHRDFGGHDLPDLLSCPRLRSLLRNDRIIAPAQILLGQQLVYYAETAINFEETIGPLTLNPYRALHCDAYGAPQGLQYAWRPDPLKPSAIYPSFRFAIYLQDYRDYSGGLKVIPGSHLVDKQYFENEMPKRYWQPVSKRLTIKCEERHFPLFNVPSQPGDLVIWNLNTFHAAGAVRLKLDRRIALMPEVEKQLLSDHADVVCDQPGPRNAIFFDYGAPSQETDLYAKSRAISRNQGFLKLKHSAESKDVSAFHEYWTYDFPALEAEMRPFGVQLRFDSLIISLALFLNEQLKISNGDFNYLFSPELRAHSERLLNICSRHVEYSPYFPLFNMDALNKAEHSPFLALQIILDGVSKLKVLPTDA